MRRHEWLRGWSALVRRGSVVALGVVLVIPALSACATPSPNGQAAGDTSTSTGPGETSAGGTDPGGPQATEGPGGASAGSPGTGNEGNPGDMTDPKPPGVDKTLRGMVAAGVEANCVLLNADDGKQYLLLGGDRQVIMGGGRIEVTGQIQPDLMTTCQQGTPFTVATARKA